MATELAHQPFSCLQITLKHLGLEPADFQTGTITSSLLVSQAFRLRLERSHQLFWVSSLQTQPADLGICTFVTNPISSFSLQNSDKYRILRNRPWDISSMGSDLREHWEVRQEGKEVNQQCVIEQITLWPAGFNPAVELRETMQGLPLSHLT